MLMPFAAAATSAGTPDRSRIVGMQAIVSHLFAEHDINPLWNELMQRVALDGTDAAAMLDLATILHSLGKADEARRVLQGAVSLQRDFCIVHGNGRGPRLLAFVTPGDFMANTPLDFLLAGSDCVLWLHYVDADTISLDDLPAHDVAFMAIGELSENVPVLNRMEVLLADFPGPVMNNDPRLIRNLTRDGVSAMLAGEPSILSPPTLRFSREELQAVASADACVSALAFPLVVRPVSTHAGNGMERITTGAELTAWLEGESASEIYAAPFVDFRGPDQLYNKQRIVFIKGRAYASHMALSEHWIVHYLSAGMARSAAKRAVEQAWMENFDTDFAVRHAEAFAALHRHIGLDYFGIDSAELPDGRLLVFEVDVAMVVHNMDSATLYPYKRVAMRKLFDAFVEAVRDSAVRAPEDRLSA
jgi:glutathione synthase/RimK-type ligase-like ATP-grasp enzyme